MKLLNSEMKINVEFKSFSIKYMTWLFSQSESKNLYMEFTEKNGEKIFMNLLETVNFETKIEKDYSKFINNLKFYIFNLPKIYNNIETNNHCSAPVTAICPIPPNNNILIEGLYEMDIKTEDDNFLNIFRKRSNNRLLDEEVVDQEEELLLNDLFFHNSYGDLNLSKDIINENYQDNYNDNFLNEE